MLKSFLQGRWIGHPLHPMIVHLPIGLVALSLIFDIGSHIHHDHVLVSASILSMALAIVTALIAAAPGLADYLDIRTDHPAHKTATVHMILNLAAVALHIVNLSIRWSDSYLAIRTAVPTLPLVLSIIGVGLIALSGYLGAVLVYDNGIGVGRNHRDAEMPHETIFKMSLPCDEWVMVAPATLKDGETIRASIDGQMTAIIKDHGVYFAAQEFCTHRCGPLSEGTCVNGKIVCPWHGSQFDLHSGEVEKGPARTNLKTWEVSVRDGQIAVRVRQQPSVSLGPIWRSDAERLKQAS